MGKVRNQSPAEEPSSDTDKLDLSLSICLNDSDAQVGSLEKKKYTGLNRCVYVCVCHAV